jgi:hypothetical protein
LGAVRGADDLAQAADVALGGEGFSVAAAVLLVEQQNTMFRVTPHQQMSLDLLFEFLQSFCPT